LGQLAVPGRNELNGCAFNIRAAGNFEVGSGGACPNVTIDVVANTGTISSPTYTVIMTSGAITAQNLTGTFYDWFFDGEVQGTTGSGTLQGAYDCVVDTTLVKNHQALTNTLTGLVWGPTATQQQGANIATTDPVFGLLVRVTFSVSEPGNAANLYQFELY
jgi:hypothetical protein